MACVTAAGDGLALELLLVYTLALLLQLRPLETLVGAPRASSGAIQNPKVPGIVAARGSDGKASAPPAQTLPSAASISG